MTKKRPFFSIITCTLNSQKYLEKNIKSVENQTFKDFEQIFIDGNSGDKTVALIKGYQKNYPHQVKLFQSQPKGIADAMNLGIKKARGKFLIHLHSDDLFYDSKVLNDVHQFLIKHTKYDWIYGQVNILKNSIPVGKVFPDWKIFQISWSYLLKFADFIPHQAVFIKKSVFAKHGLFDRDNPSAMDYELWLRIKDHTTWGYINRVISNFRIHPNSKSTGPINFAKHIEARNQVQKTYSNPLEYLIIWTINQWNDRRYKNRIS
jgi:glycosyltransferase involved in cell wall biosynthesis